jgi:hypothetical protein
VVDTVNSNRKRIMPLSIGEISFDKLMLTYPGMDLRERTNERKSRC